MRPVTRALSAAEKQNRRPTGRRFAILRDVRADHFGGPMTGGGAWIGTRVMFIGEVYLLSEPDAESMAQPMPPPRTMLPNVAPAASDLFIKVACWNPGLSQ